MLFFRLTLSEPAENQKKINHFGKMTAGEDSGSGRHHIYWPEKSGIYK
jgi:hypothetical protein